ncbi:hypothetical protein [Jiangella mangrovi]|uniref:Uncharacterized protein n=1 Tax=Jiangella mangrovi TaxID=1524084 RepID=A0A7W9GXB5_9ACTN|nr:hypothetical protein [Jiangella mangrovi]MBB5791778.1 hypothetical protein [Jiangella mangrovi]
MGTKISETAVREAAETRLAELADELGAAEAAHGDLTSRLGQGDASISAAELADAAATIERAKLLTAAARTSLEDARNAERVAVARAMAERLATRPPGDPAPAMEELRETLVSALRSFKARVNGSSGQIERALREAREAGLVRGHVDPSWGVETYSKSVHVHGYGGQRVDVLEINGRAFTKLDVEALAVEVLTAAFEDAGLALVAAEEV